MMMNKPISLDDYEKMNTYQEVKTSPYPNNKLKVTKGEKYFILDPTKFDINTIMTLLDLKKLNKIEGKFQKSKKGLSQQNFIKLVSKEFSTDEVEKCDEINFAYGLYRLFNEIDLAQKKNLLWSEFTQFIIDRVKGEDDSTDPNDIKGRKEREMQKFKRYMLSEKVKDYNIHKKDIISPCYYSKLDKLFLSEYDSKILKMYNPKTGRCDYNFDIEAYFQEKRLEEEKLKKNIYAIKKKKFHIETVKSITFSILSTCVHPMNVVAICLSSNKICFFDFGIDNKGELLYEMATPILQKKVWYLREHGIWVSTGRKIEKDKFFYLYELDIDFEKVGNKIEVLYNQGHWYRTLFFENPSKGPNKDKGHRDEILDVIEITKPLLILTASLDGKIRLFNLNDKEYLKVWESHKGGVRSLAYNPLIDTNGLVLSSGFEYHINIFSNDLSIDDAYKGKLEGHYAPVVCVKYLADSYMAASVDEDSIVKIWDTKQRLCLQSILPEKKNMVVSGLFYMKLYNRFIVYGNKMVFYDPKYKDSEINKINKDDADFNYPIQTEFNKYYMRFYIATLKDIRIYSSKNGILVYVFKNFLEHEGFDNDTKLKCFCFDHRERLLYLGFTKGAVHQFNAGNGSLVKTVNEYEDDKEGISHIRHHHTKEVTSIFLYQGKTCINDKKKKDNKDNKDNKDINTKENEIETTNRRKINFLSGSNEEKDDRLLITTGMDSIINIYDENDVEKESTKIRVISGSHKIGEKNNEILCFDFSKRYNLFATGSIDGLVVVWDFEYSQLESLCFIKSYEANFNALCIKFLDPYPVLAVGYSNGDIFLWGTNPIESKYKGECFFRFKNYYRGKTDFYPVKVTQMNFIQNDTEDSIPKNLQYETEFMEKMPSNISVDEDLQNNSEYYQQTENKTKSYLITGDCKGWLKIYDMNPIFKKFNITPKPAAQVSSSFNIKKKEEINASSLLMYEYQKSKKFLCSEFTCMYPNIIKFEKLIHNDEIVHISILNTPFAFITTSKDRRVRIFNIHCELVGEMFTGVSAPNPPLCEWKFGIDVFAVREKEMTDFFKVAEEIKCEMCIVSKSPNVETSEKEPITNNININMNDNLFQNTAVNIQGNVQNTSSLFQTVPPNVEKVKRRFKKIENNKEKRSNNNDDELKNAESYEVTRLREMKNEIDQLFSKHGEKKGMNEMSRNLIDSVATNKDISELFQQSSIRRKLSVKQKALPKINVNMSAINHFKHFNKEDREKLFSEKFASKAEDDVNRALKLPLINHEFKETENVKFQQGETENILGFEYYNNCYKQCCNLKPNEERVDFSRGKSKDNSKLRPNEERLEILRENYDLMWKFVDNYAQSKKKNKFKKENYKVFNTEI